MVAVVDVPMRISTLVGIRFRELKFRLSRTPVRLTYARSVLDFVDRRRHEDAVFLLTLIVVVQSCSSDD